MKRRKFIQISGGMTVLGTAGCTTKEDPSTNTGTATIIDYEVVNKVDKVGIKTTLKENNPCDANWIIFLKWKLYDKEEQSSPVREDFTAVSINGMEEHTIWLDVSPDLEFVASLMQVSQKEYWEETGNKISYPSCRGDI